MFTAGHPEEDVLERYAMGKSDLPEVDAVEEHILVCVSCQERVDFLDTYLPSMKSALANAEKAGAETPWRSRIGGWFQMPAPVWAGATAVVLLALGAFYGTRYTSPSGTPVAVVLTATRGETASIVATSPLDISLDARGLNNSATYKVQVVNGEGGSVWEQPSAAVQDGYVRVRVGKRLSRGQYFVRLFGSDAGTPREYALQLR